MKNQFNLNISTPCSENFNQFTPTSNGGFCGSCEKEVIDFTAMNAQEIINYFKTHNKQNTCGRFKNKQLKTYNQNIIQRKKVSLMSGIALVILSFFSMHSTGAQNTKQQIESTGNPSEINASKFQKHILVKGTVTEASLALPAVNVILEGTTIGTQTDFDGHFEFPEKLKKGDVLIFSYLGMESQKVVIDNKNSASKIDLKINMSMDSCILMGKVAVKDIYKSKRK